MSTAVFFENYLFIKVWMCETKISALWIRMNFLQGITTVHGEHLQWQKPLHNMQAHRLSKAMKGRDGRC